MSEGPGAVTILAPRELRDFVYRCCRVQGVDPGTADRFADNLLHAQIHRGASVETFLSVLVSSSSSADDLTRVTTAADSVELAEATARIEGVATATFDSAVPLMALSHSLWHAATRGVASIGISPTAPGDQHVESIEFVTQILDTEALDPVALDPVALDPVALDPVALDPVALDPVALDPVARASAQQRHLSAHHLGLPVATSSLVQLESRAARFLVDELTLDAITP